MSPRQGSRVGGSNVLERATRILSFDPNTLLFFFLFLSHIPRFLCALGCKQPYCTTHKILRVRLCATHKNLRCSRLFCCRREVSILLSRHYHNAYIYIAHHILYIFDRYTEAYITYDSSFPGNGWWILCWPIRTTGSADTPSHYSSGYKTKKEEI